MTIIDKVNLGLTVASIIVTIISIVCSVLSWHFAKKAKQYKEETLTFKESIDLLSLLSKFRNESQKFQDNTREIDWYKGQNANLIISPFNQVLLSFGNYYHLMKDAEEIKSKVHSLQKNIQAYSTFTSSTQKKINRLIIEITELLQKEIQNITHAMVVN